MSTLRRSLVAILAVMTIVGLTSLPAEAVKSLEPLPPQEPLHFSGYATRINPASSAANPGGVTIMDASGNGCYVFTGQWTKRDNGGRNAYTFAQRTE